MMAEKMLRKDKDPIKDNGVIIISGDAILWSKWLTKENILSKYGDHLSKENLEKLDEKWQKDIK